MGKNYSTLTEQQINNLIKEITVDSIQQDKKLDFEEFRIISKNYINKVQKYINNLQNRKNLLDRISAIGGLMHNDLSSVQQLLVLSHTYQTALNNFLGRKIPITWVSKTGNIKIVQESAILKAYGSANLGLSAQHGSGNTSYVGRIEGVNNSTFQKELLDPQLKDLQEQLTRSAQNKKRVFIQAKRRWNDSINMAYASNPKTANKVKNIYYRVAVANGSRLRSSGKISNPGYIGQGYVAMVLHTKNDQLNNKITFPTSKQAPPYNLIAQDYLRILANYALQGDTIPGIIQGDVKATEDGNIQLAIKQGSNFSSASIAGNIAIAYAILYNSQNNGIMNPEILRQQLENVKTTKWQDIFQALTGVLAKNVNELELNFLIDLL